MKQILEWSGMWTVLAGVVIGAIGIIVLVIDDESWGLYVVGWIVAGLGLIILFWAVLRDRLRARKTEDLDDVGFN
jgi:hypothetical protein